MSLYMCNAGRFVHSSTAFTGGLDCCYEWVHWIANLAMDLFTPRPRYLQRGYDMTAWSWVACPRSLKPTTEQIVSSCCASSMHSSSASENLSLTNTRSISSSSYRIAYLFAAMDQTQLSDELDTCVPYPVQESFTRRQRLRAIVASYRDLYDPPNTAAAFDLLEAALDEAKRNEDGGKGPMLDAPTTAERFFRLESAMDEVLAQPATMTGRPKRSKSEPKLSTRATASDSHERAHLLRKRQHWLTEQNMPAGPHCSTEIQWAERKSAGWALPPRAYFLRDTTIPPRRSSIDWSRTADEVRTNTHSATEMLIPRISTPPDDPNRDVDIFRSDEAMESFINQTFEAARAWVIP